MTIQERVNNLIKEDYTIITKMALCYELNTTIMADVGDDLIDVLYKDYINSEPTNVADYVNILSHNLDDNDLNLETLELVELEKWLIIWRI